MPFKPLLPSRQAHATVSLNLCCRRKAERLFWEQLAASRAQYVPSLERCNANISIDSLEQRLLSAGDHALLPRRSEPDIRVRPLPSTLAASDFRAAGRLADEIFYRSVRECRLPTGDIAC